MILPAFGALLMPAVGAPMLLDSGGGAAGRAAITLSAVTVFTDPEHGVTPTLAAGSLTQNHFAVNRHARRSRRRRELDNNGPIMSG